MDRPGEYRVGCRRRPYTFTCRVCGKLFRAKRCTATYCTTMCRMQAMRTRKAKRGE